MLNLRQVEDYLQSQGFQRTENISGLAGMWYTLYIYSRDRIIRAHIDNSNPEAVKVNLEQIRREGERIEQFAVEVTIERRIVGIATMGDLQGMVQRLTR